MLFQDWPVKEVKECWGLRSRVKGAGLGGVADGWDAADDGSDAVGQWEGLGRSEGRGEVGVVTGGKEGGGGGGSDTMTFSSEDIGGRLFLTFELCPLCPLSGGGGNLQMERVPCRFSLSEAALTSLGLFRAFPNTPWYSSSSSLGAGVGVGAGWLEVLLLCLRAAYCL